MEYQVLTSEHNEMVKIKVEKPVYGWTFTLQWNETQWKQWLGEAVSRKDFDTVRLLRREVYLSTLEIIKKGWGYQTTDGNHVPLPWWVQEPDKVVKKGRGYQTTDVDLVVLPLESDIAASTKFYAKEIHPLPLYEERYDTEICVMNCDCLKIARELCEQREGDDVCVLNLASRQNPGGGVIHGSGAQEEGLFRRSDYYRSLYQYAPYAEQYGVKRSNEHSYPLDRNFGGIFSPHVTVFRAGEREGYRLLNHPWRVNFIAVAGLNHPPLVMENGEERLAPNVVEGVKNKMRTILRIAVDNGQRVLILGALGCGAFRNPPKHTAELFSEVLGEQEFQGVFERVIFAIKEDHNSRGMGNYQPFAEVFNSNSAKHPLQKMLRQLRNFLKRCFAK